VSTKSRPGWLDLLQYNLRHAETAKQRVAMIPRDQLENAVDWSWSAAGGLEQRSITGISLLWFRSCLSDSTHNCCDNVHSANYAVQCSGPSGLGPQSFCKVHISYIEDVNADLFYRPKLNHQ